MESNEKEIEKLKEQYGDIYSTTDSKGKVAYFRKPKRAELSYAVSLQQAGKSLEMLEQVIKSCFVYGDRVFVDDTDHILGAAPLVEQLIRAEEIVVKKV